MLDGSTVTALARAVGFHRAAIVDPGLFAPRAETTRTLRESAFLDRAAFHGLEWDWVLEPDRWSVSRSVLVCCLSCFRREPDDLSSPGDPHVLIAPFARANYYRAAMDMLRDFADRLEGETRIPRASLRLFANSRLPEKPLLAASGLGTCGANSLALVPGLGSLFVIAGAVIPVPSAQLLRVSHPPTPDLCGSCRRCIEECPTGAIVEPGRVRSDRCLQGLAGVAVSLPPATMESWGARLYGCQACQASCPHNSGLSQEARPAPGELGPSISISRVLSLGAKDLKGWFRGTAMGMSWVSGDALLRNALIAAGNRRDPAVRSNVADFAESRIPLLRDTSRWALERIAEG